MITLLMDADMLINLTDIDGLFDKDPRTHPDAELIPVVSAIEKRIENYAGEIPGALGTGGMRSKIKAARKVTAAGVPMIIANGARPDILTQIFHGEAVGTLFVPKKEKLASRKCWIAFNLTPEGVLWIDDGAARAILRNGKSLLPSGIEKVDGDFGVGAPVTFKNRAGETLGTGLVNYAAADVRKIMGCNSGEISALLGDKPYDEVIHRDNLAVSEACLVSDGG
jgi:glutamate 5-kinase